MRALTDTRPVTGLALFVAIAVGLAVSVCLPPPTGANPLIAQALEAGVLDRETAMLYELYGVLDPDSMPAEYRQPPGPATCGTPAIARARAAREEFSADYRRSVDKLLQQRPSLDRSVLSPSGYFRVHYSLDGFDAVDPTDENGNDIPDYIDLAAAALDSAWRLEIDVLGYKEPPSDGGAGGGVEYDAYVVELGRTDKYGLTQAERFGATSPSHMRIDNNYTDATYGRVSACIGAVGTRELDALHVTTAHEFFHAVQFGYYHGTDGQWWEEASSTWIEEVAYPEADDYLQYVCDFILAPDRSLDSGSAFSAGTRIYGASIFAHFLDQRYHRDLIRTIWEQHGRRANASTDNFDHALRDATPGGLADVVSEFALWNYFTGVRHRDGFYEEADKWPTVLVQTHHPVDGATIEVEGRLDHLASAYIKLDPQLLQGGLILETELDRGGWIRQLALVSSDEVEILRTPDTVTPLSVPDWDTYQEIVLILTNTERVGIGFRYVVTAEYDHTLTERPIPPAFALGDSYPNPFLPKAHSRVTIPFELNRPSFVTRMSIFTARGELMRRYDLQSLAPNAHIQAWDGRNEADKLVGSGIYYYVLEADGAEAEGSLTLVRD